MITLAPEIDGLFAAIKAIRAVGVVTAVGRTSATCERTVLPSTRLLRPGT